MYVEYVTDIDAAIEDVFTLVESEDGIAQWMTGLVDMTYPGHPSEHPVGTRFKQTYRERGRITEYDGEVLAYDRPRHLGVRLKGRQFAITVNYEFSPIPTGTSLQYTAEFNCTQAFAHRMNDLFNWFSRRVLVRQMRNLKRLAEGNAREREAGNS